MAGIKLDSNTTRNKAGKWPRIKLSKNKGNKNSNNKYCEIAPKIQWNSNEKILWNSAKNTVKLQRENTMKQGQNCCETPVKKYYETAPKILWNSNEKILWNRAENAVKQQW
jgi:hypothetical protein